MQCPDCGYISFKQERNCGSCGFNFKKASVSNSSLFRNDSFTFFSSPKTSGEKQKSISSSSPQLEESLAAIDSPKDSQEYPELESEEFLLNLSDAKQEQPEDDLKLDSSEQRASSFMPMASSTGDEIHLEEMEVEGLGLEPLEEKTTTIPETSKTEEIQFERNEGSSTSNLDLATKSTDSSDNLALTSDELDIKSSSQQEIDDSTLKSITLNISDIDEPSKIDLQETCEEQEIVTSSSQGLEQNLLEPEDLVLDLGDTEIELDLDEGTESGSPDPSSVSITKDELEIKLEVDDSDGPPTYNDDETPEIEIESLGLELEDSDAPTPDREKL